MDTYGRWGRSAAEALRTAARARLRRPDARRAVRASGVLSRLLTRWRAAGAVALQRRNFAVWSDCLSFAGSPSRSCADADAPVELSDSMGGLLVGSATF
eukprot:4990143-Heterocapsa_arctica.AAC.1